MGNDANTNDIFKQIRLSVAAGLSKEDLESKRNLRVAPGVTVGEYIRTCIDFGEMTWREGKIVFSSRNGM